MEPVRSKRYVFLTVVFLAAAVVSHGCGQNHADKCGEVKKTPLQAAAAENPVQMPGNPPAESPQTTEALEPEALPAPKSDKAAAADPPAPQSEGDAAENDDLYAPETAEETARRLGPPLVEQPENLQRLDAIDSIWIDPQGRRLVMVGEVCQRRAPLEMFACLWHTKEHEAVLTARVKAMTAHAGLLALGAKAGHPVQFMPEYAAADGAVVDVEVFWRDKDGKIQKSRAQEWIRDFQTKKAMQSDWVFAGSGFWTDEQTGKRYYQAESGDFICVSNFSTAMLDLPVESSQQNDALMFEAFTERIPPLGTPVTIVLKPRLDKEAAK